MANQLPNLSSRTSGGSSFHFASIPVYKPKKDAYSARQMAEIQAAMAKHKESRSFWDQVKGGTGSLLGKALNVIMRPTWAMAEGTRRATEGKGFDTGDFFKGASRGIQGKRQTTFSEVLKQENILNDNKVWRAIAGFGLDVVTDPTNLALLAATPFTGGASAAVLAARQVAIKASARSEVGKIAGHATRKEAFEALKVLDAGGPGFRPARVLIEKELKLDSIKSSGIGRFTQKDVAELRMAQGAVAEDLRRGMGAVNVVQPRVIVPFAKRSVPLLPAGIKGVRTLPKTPNLLRTSQRGGVLGKVPLVAKTAGAVGKVFKPGFGDTSVFRSAMVRRHGADRLTDEYLNKVRQTFKGYKGEDEEWMLEALAFGERKGMVNRETRELNIKDIQKGVANHQITQKQAQFLEDWHGWMEHLRYQDKVFGIPYKKELNRLYVPHVYTKDGLDPRKLTDQVKNGPTYQMARKNEMSVKMIRDLKMSGDQTALKEIETNPLKLMEMRTRRGARAHMDSAYIGFLGKAVAVPKGQGYDVVEFGLAGQKVIVPRETASMLKRIERVTMDEGEFAKFEKAWFKSLGAWKITVTTINPGYHIRNSLSDVWGMYISGVPAWAIGRYSVEASHFLLQVEHAAGKLARGKTLTTKEQKALNEMSEAIDHGTLSGMFPEDVWKEITPKRKATMLLHTFGRNRENWGRLIHYLYRTRSEGLSPAEAAVHVRSAHFDYSELTEIERRKFKAVIPFYTWSRKNIPFQIQQLVARPGRVSAFPKFAQEMEFAAEGGDGDILPEYMQNTLSFKVPWGDGDRYVNPQIGLADLMKLEDPKQFAAMIGPHFKIPIELMTGKSLFTGQDLKGVHPRNPVNDPFGITTGLVGSIPGADVGPTTRPGFGQKGKVVGLGAHPYVSYAFGQTPLTHWLFNKKASIKKAQARQGSDNNTTPADIAYLGGLSFYDVDQETNELIEQLNWKDDFNKMVKGLRDTGMLPPPDQTEDSDYQKMINEILYSKVRRGG